VKAVTEIRERWAPLDPAAGDHDLPGPGTRRSTLEAILASPLDTRPDRASAHRRRPISRWVTAVTAAAGLTVLAAGLFAVHHRNRPADVVPPDGSVATPVLLSYQSPAGESGARERLLAVADAAAARPAPSPADLPEHLRIRSWSLFTRIDDRRITSAIVPVDTELWRASDDSGRMVQRYGEPQFPNDGARRSWDPPSGLDQTRTERYGAGEFPAMWRDRPPAATDSAAAWLRIGHPPENGPAETIVAVTDLARERVLTPGERAAMLRVVAALPGLKYHGSVEDRVGRTGVGFSVDSAYSGLMTRYMLIVDERTGALLGHEEMLTRTAGKLGVAIPSVVSYEAYLVRNYAAIP